jgi:TolA-binding protein
MEGLNNMDSVTSIIADGGSMIPGEWLTAFVVAVIGAIGAAWARYSGVEKGKREQEVTLAGQPIRTTKEPRQPTWAEVQSLERRLDAVEKHLDSMRDAQSRQFQQLLEAGHARELRIMDTISAAVGALGAKMNQDVRSAHERIDHLTEKIKTTKA